MQQNMFSMAQISFVFILVLGSFSSTIMAKPNNRLYYLFNDDNSAFRLSPYYRSYDSSVIVPASDSSASASQTVDTDKRTPMKKNYDRNCFFSPVQCMLSYNTKTHHDAYYGRK